MPSPELDVTVHLPDGVSIHGADSTVAASRTRSAAEEAARIARDSATLTATTAYEAALFYARAAKDVAEKAANDVFAAATGPARATRDTAIATAQQVFDRDPGVVAAKATLDGAIRAADLIRVESVRNAAKDRANSTYDAATAVQRAALDAAIATAEHVYSMFVQGAEATRQSAIEAAGIAYGVAEAAASRDRDIAIGLADAAYNSAMAVARNNYDTAVAAPSPVSATVGLNIAGNPDKAVAVKVGAEVGGTGTPITLGPISLSVQGGREVSAATASARNAAEEAARAARDAAASAAQAVYSAALRSAEDVHTTTLERINAAFAAGSAPRPPDRGGLIAPATGRSSSSALNFRTVEEAIRAAGSIYEQARSEARNVLDAAMAAADAAYNTAMQAAKNSYEAAAPSPVAAKVDVSLSKLPKARFRLAGLDIGFYLFSWRIFSIKVKGEADIGDTAP